VAIPRTTAKGATCSQAQDSIRENNDASMTNSLGDAGDALDYFDEIQMENLFPHVSMFLDHDSGGLSYPDLEDPTSSLSFGTSGTSESPDGPNAKGAQDGQHNDTFTTASEPLQPPHINILESDPRLSSLVLDMSRRIQQCIAISGPQNNPVLDPALSGSDMTKLFGDALGDLSEFVVIIQKYRCPDTPASSSTLVSQKRRSVRSNPNERTSTTASGGGWNPRPPSFRIGIVVILNLLSAYIQVVAIFDRLFQALLKQLSEPSNPVPNLHLAGFSVQPGNLQTKILTHAILHQFEMIERILGVPAELIVTEKSEGLLGLLGERWGRELLGALSKGRGAPLVMDDDYNLRAVERLRETIERVQMILSM
jgi:hypothetical protein